MSSSLPTFRRLKIQAGLAAAALCVLAVPAHAADDETWAIARPADNGGASPMFFKSKQDGHQWLALVAGAHRWTLEPIADVKGDLGEPAGPSPVGTLVLLRYATLKAGLAPTPEMRFSGRRRVFEPGTPSLRMTFGTAAYEIAVRDEAVWLQQGARRTKIGEAHDDKNMGYDFRTELLWAGDLDSDGRLDVIVIEDNGGYSNDLCLYLSGDVHNDHELLEKVACEDWSG